MQSEPNTPQTPFQVNVADRVKRLPPYLFGKINALKYAKRRAGVDVIDLGMGNPTDVPEAEVVEKLREALGDDKSHRYSMANGIPNLRREVAHHYRRIHGVDLSLDCTQPDKFLSSIATVSETLYPRPKVVILNYPHNPSMTVVERDFFVEIVKLAKRYGFMVIHDFAYGDVCFDGYKAPSVLSVPGAKDVGVETTT